MKNSLYRQFAQVYDIFMSAVPYKRWAGYISEMLQSHGIAPGALVLDVACGTGTMAFLMAEKGYEMIGVDASADMLSEALNKKNKQDKKDNKITKKKGRNILFLNQDILALDLYGTVDAAYSTCDALNYIMTDDDFEKVLRNVLLFLNPGGIFIFDLKTETKYRQLGNSTYHDSSRNASYIWKNRYDADTMINEYHVKFFVDGKESFSETHRQRAYTIKTITDLAQQAGFNVQAVKDNYTYDPVRPESERATYILTTPIKG